MTVKLKYKNFIVIGCDSVSHSTTNPCVESFHKAAVGKLLCHFAMSG